MFYNKKDFTKTVFKNPPSEYRAMPFWAWNCELEEDELLWQIEQLKKMGFGGFHMHTRSGMATTYLGDEFIELVKKCTEKAKKEGMLAWLYDEDRFPSGAAGGYVTKNKKFCQRQVRFTTKKNESIDEKKAAVKNGGTYLLGIYDIELNSNGELMQYRTVKSECDAKGIVWYAYVEGCIPNPKGWYNGETYVDTLNKEAIDEFIRITHEKYKEAVGKEFGKTVPAIFTDEPQFSKKGTLPFAQSREDVTLPWTPDFDDTFFSVYGFDIKEKFPELVWELSEKRISEARYLYHDHICQRFTEAFSDNIGAWCEKEGISLTGHMLLEETLLEQTSVIGEAMRAYRSFQLPGMDLLCNGIEYSTAKQVQSAVHQYGREGAMSELYGVTGWEFDFRGHKSQGDWQAALGVTVRVPHLSWVSMKGSAKRDYPASISYQSPWYKEYPYIENHFARLNTVLTRGNPCVNVAVIHPIESYWLHFGPNENTADIRNQMEENFQNVIKWLLHNTIDFDFICESLFPALVGSIGKELTVGKMKYSAILIPECETLRKSTVDILNKFIDNGGKVIFAGKPPKYIDAVKNDDVQKLYKKAIAVPFNKLEILDALNDEREIEIKDIRGAAAEQFVYQLREESDKKYLFVARVKPSYMDNYGNKTTPIMLIKLKGEFTPELMNTLTGETERIAFKVENGFTLIEHCFYDNDSLLLCLKPFSVAEYKCSDEACEILGEMDFKTSVKLVREEENVCLLDMAEVSFDGDEMMPIEEILRADSLLRKKIGWPDATGYDVQPWAIEKEKITHKVKLRFVVFCDDELKNTCLCAEELSEIELNGEKIKVVSNGYFVDKAIKKYELPTLKKGENIITVTHPYGKCISLEACYLIGEFDVTLCGCEKTLSKPKKTIAFGDIASQGLPFYGGNLSYITEIELPQSCNLNINISRYRGALTKVILDGKECGNIVFDPYNLKIENVSKGVHTIEFKLFGNRHNCFGALHSLSESKWIGPNFWYENGKDWCYEYNTKKTGILKSPVITMYR